MTRPPLTPAQRALLERRLRGRPASRAAAAARPRARRDAATRSGTGQPAPLSAEQEQLYIHTLLTPGHRVYNEAITIVRVGAVDLPALRAALRGLVARHDILHTTFRRRGRSVRQIVQPVPEFPLELVDLSTLPDGDRWRRTAQLVGTLARERYDLAAGPLVRPLLIRHSPAEHRLHLAMHHLIFDGVSLYRILLPELVEFYEAAVAGRPPDLPEPVQYADYARWQHAGALDAELLEALPYWRDRLTALPRMRWPEPAAARGGDGGGDGRSVDEEPSPAQMTGFTVPADVAAGLRRVATAARATPFHVVAAAFATLLRDLTGERDVVFATVADRRNRQEWERMVGYCLTPVLLRIRVPDRSTVQELIPDTRDELLRALEHLVPYERLVRDLAPVAADGPSAPLFRAMLVLEPPAVPVAEGWSLHQLDAAIGSWVGNAKTDLHIELDERPDGHLAGRCIVNVDALPADFAPNVLARFQQLLVAVTRHHPAAH